MSNSIVMLGLLLSIMTENNSMESIGIDLLNTLLKKVLPSSSFQKFIFFP